MSTPNERLAALSREERLALCREVLENLSGLIEGTAPPDFCERVEEVLGDCQAFHAYRDTLAATIELARECGQHPPAGETLDEQAFGRCVEAVRQRLSDRESG
jgi:hypothetical protein